MNATIVFLGQIWAFGPLHGKPTLWNSPDGITWRFPGSSASENIWSVLANDAPEFGTTGAGYLSFNDYLWAIGGASIIEREGAFEGEPDSYFNGIEKSSDGLNWQWVAPVWQWEGRAWHACVVFDDRMWVLGGYNGDAPQQPYLNDVWSSSNGMNWVQESASAPWSPRAHHGCVVHDGKLWVLGGQGADGEYLADVWYSSNGVDWTLQTEAAPWGSRRRHGVVSFNDELLVIGGERRTSPHYYRDIWAYGTRPPEASSQHAADLDGDQEFSLSELLRVIQFFNAGGIACQCDTEDNFAPGTGDTLCSPHSSDYNPQDWSIDLNELLRAIQFYNVGGYTYCPESGTEDGFCPSSGL
jgi:hypothetical protein